MTKEVLRMSGLLMAILFWCAGIALLIGSYSITSRLRKASEELLMHSEHEKGKDNSASIALRIEGKILDYIPSYLFQIAFSVFGSLLIAFGFVALAFFFG
ncbi:hypothetical protein [Sporolactobacillus spathodeae]|nr:hypothetical protein [Sporolactobacillus spathodeae]